MEHAKLAKSHGILLSVMEFNNFAPELYEVCMFFANTKKLTIHVESLHFPMFSAKCHKCEN